MRPIKQHFGILRFSLFLFFIAICIVSANARQKTPPTDLPTLWKQLRLAGEQRRPKDAGKLAELIAARAEREKNFPYLLCATVIGSEADIAIDPERLPERYRRLHNLTKLTWLTRSDRCMVSQALFNAYYRACETSCRTTNIHAGRPEPQIGDDPASWASNDYRLVLTALFEQMTAEAGKLDAVPASSYKPYCEQFCSSETDSYSQLGEDSQKKATGLAVKEDGSLLALILNGIATQQRFRAYTISTYMDHSVMIHRLDKLLARTLSPEAQFYAKETLLRTKNAAGIITDEVLGRALQSLVTAYPTLPAAILLYSTLLPDNPGNTWKIRQGKTGDTLYRTTSADLRPLVANIMATMLDPCLSVCTNELIRPGDSIKLDFGHVFGIDRLHIRVKRIMRAANGYAKGHLQEKMNESIYEKTLDFATDKNLLARTNSISICPLIEAGRYRISIKAYPTRFYDYLPEMQIRDRDLDVYVSRLYPLFDGNPAIRILDYKTGLPVPDAGVAIYDNNQMASRGTPGNTFTTDSTGLTSTLPKGKYTEPFAPGDVCYPPTYDRSHYFDQSYNPQQTESFLYLFTDRPVYRPGQQVRIGGFAYRLGMRSSAGRVIANTNLSAILYDANGNAIDSTTVRTDADGNFSRDFRLPSRGLSGQFCWILHSDSLSVSGYAPFYVEEYKRPTFSVVLAEPTTEVALGKTAEVSGVAKLYAGFGVSNARVAFSVKVNKWSYYYGVYHPNDTTGETIIASDTVKTDADGHFRIPVQFSVPTEFLENTTGEDDGISYNYYLFCIEASVIAPDGETHQNAIEMVVGNPKTVLTLTGFNDDEHLLVNKQNPEQTKLRYLMLETGNRPSEASVRYTLYALEDPEKEKIKGDVAAGTTFSLPAAIASLPSGVYLLKAEAETKDGRKAEHCDTLTIFAANDSRIPAEFPLFCYDLRTEYDSINTAQILVGSCFENAMLFYDIIGPTGFTSRHSLKMIAGKLYRLYPQLPKNELAASYAIAFYLVHNGQTHGHTSKLSLTEPEKRINVKRSVFRDKAKAGSTENMTFTLSDAEGKPLRTASMSALMYDASLDAVRHYFTPANPYVRLSTRLPLQIRPQNPVGVTTCAQNFVELKLFDLPRIFRYRMPFSYAFPVDSPYPDLEYLVLSDGYAGPERSKNAALRSNLMLMQTTTPLNNRELLQDAFAREAEEINPAESKSKTMATEQNPTLRSDMRETALFIPNLHSDNRGRVQIQVKLPETITRWNLFLAAHTRDMLFGTDTATIEAGKDLVIIPNLPRFLRTGDDGLITATIYNYTDKSLAGKSILELYNPADKQILYRTSRPFSVKRHASTSVAFPCRAIKNIPVVGLRVLAETDTFSDGEQHLLPQLSNIEPVHRALPYTLQPGETRTFSLDSLLPPGSRPVDLSITHESEAGSLSAVLRSLPILTNLTANSVIDIAASIYANRLAFFLTSFPELRKLFRQQSESAGAADTLSPIGRRFGEAFDMMADEMPWMRVMRAEEQNAAAVHSLLDSEKLETDFTTLSERLISLQSPDGSFAWYPGLQPSTYTTAYIAELLGRLYEQSGSLEHKLQDVYRSALVYLGKKAAERVNELKRTDARSKHKENVLPEDLLNYLYLSAQPHALKPDPKVTDYARPILLRSLSKLPKEMLPKAAVVALFWGERPAAMNAAETLRQFLCSTREGGLFFATDHVRSFYGDGSRYPLQIATIQLFSRLGINTSVIERMQSWLLASKRVQLWPVTPGTTDMIYGLLITPENRQINRTMLPRLLGSSVPRRVSYSSRDLPAGSITYTLTNNTTAVETGAYYVDYTESVPESNREITPTDLPLKMQRECYTAIIRDGEEQLRMIREGDSLTVGDILVTRIRFKADQAMDFIVLTDARAAAFEPMGKLTSTRYASGICYYMEAKDNCTNFFFDTLQRSGYSIEYRQRVVRPGTYHSGHVRIRSAYAPAFRTDISGSTFRIKPTENTAY